MVDKFFNVLMTIAIALVITSLVLPGRQTAQVTEAGFTGLSRFANASLGRG